MEKSTKNIKDDESSKSNSRTVKMTSRERMRRAYAPVDDQKPPRKYKITGPNNVPPSSFTVGSYYYNPQHHTNHHTTAPSTNSNNRRFHQDSSGQVHGGINSHHQQHHGHNHHAPVTTAGTVHHAPVSYIYHYTIGSDGAMNHSYRKESETVWVNRGTILSKNQYNSNTESEDYDDAKMADRIERKRKRFKSLTAANRRRTFRAVSRLPLDPLCTHKSSIHYSKNVLTKMLVKESRFHASDPLSNHEITPDCRSRMIDWMVECLTAYGNSQESFFYAAYVFDSYLQSCKSELSDDDVHLLGICCVFLASKYTEAVPLSIDTLAENIGYEEFTASQIQAKEMKILKTCQCEVNLITPYQFINFIMILAESSINSESYKPLFDALRNHTTQYAKMAVIKEKLLNFKPSEIALATFSIGCQEVYSKSKYDNKKKMENIEQFVSEFYLITFEYLARRTQARDML